MGGKASLGDESGGIRPDQRIDLETLRFIRDRAIPAWVPRQRLTGLARRGLAARGDAGRFSLTLAGRRELARLAELDQEVRP